MHTAAAAKSLQSCPTLCDPIDGSPPGSPVPGILQARTLECGRGRLDRDSSAVGALSNILGLLRDGGGDIWTMRPWVRAQTHGSFR